MRKMSLKCNIKCIKRDFVSGLRLYSEPGATEGFVAVQNAATIAPNQQQQHPLCANMKIWHISVMVVHFGLREG